MSRELKDVGKSTGPPHMQAPAKPNCVALGDLWPPLLTRRTPKLRLSIGVIRAQMIAGHLAMEQEQAVGVGRRLAAIVAADVAGYSRLMGFDEVGTARALREHRKVTDALVAKHGGRLVKTTGMACSLSFPR